MTAERTYVHIGPLKTGTTFIQSVLWNNKVLLAERGICLPRKNMGQHVRSVLSVMDKVVNPDDTRDLSQAWSTMTQAVAAWDGPAAVISQEFLCEAKPATVERIVHDLAPSEVHVVYTARDFTKLIPAMWQTHLRNKFAPSWREYINSVRAPSHGEDPWGERFWHQQDPASSLGRWGEHVPPDRIHVVTVPPSGSDPTLLWRRFAGLLGIADPEAFDLELDRANTSLGAVECEALRRVNLMVSGRIPGLVYQDLVKNYIAREILEAEPNEQRLVLPEVEQGWVAERARAAQEFFAAGGFDVVGDLADLDPSPSVPGTPAPDDVTEADVAAVLERMLGQTLIEMSRRQGNEAFSGPRSHEEPQPPPSTWKLDGTPPRPGRSRVLAAPASQAARGLRQTVRKLARRSR